MKGYFRYVKDVLEGKIIVCKYIRQAVERFERFRARKDIYFDEKEVDNCLTFIGMIVQFEGPKAGSPLKMEDWQQFVIACMIGLKWRKDDSRVCREVFLQVARKNGKTTLLAALSLYFLLADGEAAPQLACLATSREQAKLIFKMISIFGKQLDPTGRDIKQYRNYLLTPSNNGSCKVFSSDSSRLDGLNISFAVIDEYSALPNDDLYSVIKSSQGARKNPMLVQITTPQTSLASPGYAKYKMSIDILGQVLEDDTFWPFLYTLDSEDDWDDPNVWIKSNPNLGVSCFTSFIEDEVNKAKNMPSQINPVKIKHIGLWTSSAVTWIPREKIVPLMQITDFHDFEGLTAYLGVDLSSVSDLSALSVLIVKEGKYYFWNRSYLPEATYLEHPNRKLYERFVQEGSLVISGGNVIDYDRILHDIIEINKIVNISKIGYDKWNSSSWAIDATALGLPLQPVSQAIGNFNSPTKEMERLILNGDIVLQKSLNILWQFDNVSLKTDWNSNIKPTKESYNDKIDNVIAMIQALSVYLENPIENDFTIFSVI